MVPQRCYVGMHTEVGQGKTYNTTTSRSSKAKDKKPQSGVTGEREEECRTSRPEHLALPRTFQRTGIWRKKITNRTQKVSAANTSFLFPMS
ncbi:hypothetical protein ElyMa_000850700 [Elysia marginata]|uniref:Uncharacterized protein n=1 Tax=Elysia marginata TaxID=1093978 RepID=A0AAV4H1Y9_9GAST|nr:hypothetical protein ElyMa_000850700 [Elysia marginata]